MKHLNAALIALVIMLCGITAKAQQNSLVLQNNTTKQIRVSFVYYDSGESCWVSRGWRTIAPYSNNTINLDQLNMGSSTMYLHAENFFKNWGSTNVFCASETAPFQILFADQIKCAVRKNYDPVHIGSGQNLYTFNP